MPNMGQFWYTFQAMGCLCSQHRSTCNYRGAGGCHSLTEWELPHTFLLFEPYCLRFTFFLLNQCCSDRKSCYLLCKELALPTVCHCYRVHCATVPSQLICSPQSSAATNKLFKSIICVGCLSSPGGTIHQSLARSLCQAWPVHHHLFILLVNCLQAG